MLEKKNKVLLILLAIFAFFVITATIAGSVYLMENTHAIKEEQPKTDLTSKQFKQKKKSNKKKSKPKPVKPKLVLGTQNSTELTKAGILAYPYIFA